MKFPFLLAILLSFICLADTPSKQLTGFPFQNETLRYSANWASGVALGQGRMQAQHLANGNWEFELTLDASIPGVKITDRYRSMATPELCSVEFERDTTHGAKKSREKVTFAQDRGMAHRVTTGGGSSDFSVPGCARDALTFLYFTRREMGQGRVPPATTIVMGGPYDVGLEYKGEEMVKGATGDRVEGSARGPKSNVRFDLVFARDPARTPVVIRTPLTLGTFSLELVR